MSKRVSELLEEIETELLEPIGNEATGGKEIAEVVKSEKDGVEIENIQRETEIIEGESISINRIKTLAMMGIENEFIPLGKSIDEPIQVSNEAIKGQKNDQQGNQSISMESYRKKRRPIIRRVIVPLVAAISLTVGVVATSHYNETLRGIFGQFFPYSDQVQPIGQSMSHNGLTFTAQGAFIDEKTGLFIASFTKDDGSPFESGTEVGSISLKTKKTGGMGWNVSNQISEDGKQLNCIVNLSSSQKLHGQELTLQAEDLKVWRRLEAVSAINLGEVTSMPIANNWRNDDSKDGLGIQLSEEIAGIMLDRMAVSDKGLEMVTSYTDREGIEHESVYFSLVNQETDEIYEATDYEHYWSEEEGLNKDYTLFEGIETEDLPHLALRVSTNYYEVMIRGNWEIGFKLDQNKQIRTKRLSQIVSVGESKALIKKIQISALGVTIEGNKLSRSLSAFQNTYLQMKDGSRMNLWSNGMNSGLGGFNMYFKGQLDETSGEIKQEGVEEEVDSLTGDGVSVHLESEAFDLSQLIKIEEVESIVIEGTTIPFD